MRNSYLRNALNTLALTGLLLVSTTVTAAGRAEETQDSQAGTEPTDVTVLLDWLPNTNHTGLYVALHNGWYAEEGLNVEIIQPSEVGADQLVAAGRGQFGVSHQEAVSFARTAAEPLPIVAIATILQHNTSGYVLPSNRGVTSPGGFAGLNYGGWGTEYEDAMLNAVMGPFGVGAGDVTTVNVGTTDIFVAFERDIDFTWIFYGWDGVRAEISNIDVDYFPLAELDPRLDYYTPVIVAGEAILDEDPELARAFLRATARGYQATAADPAAAAEILRVYAPEIAPEHAAASVAYLADYYLADDGNWGRMEERVWNDFTEFMDEQALLPRPLDVASAFTNQFLPE